MGKSTLLIAVVMILSIITLVSLGTWQLYRLDWKTELILRVNARAASEPVSLAKIEARWRNSRDVGYQPVKLTGSFEHQKELFYFNTHKGRSGWDIITPFQLEDNRIVLLNRGFVPDKFRSKKKRIAGLMSGKMTIIGLARNPLTQKPNRLVPDNQLSKREFFWKSHRQMTALVGKIPSAQVLPFMVDAGANQFDWQYPIGGTTRIHFPNNHLQYAGDMVWSGRGFAGSWVGVYSRSKKTHRLTPNGWRLLKISNVVCVEKYVTRNSKQPMTLRLCGPRGFCAGVDRAIQIVVLALKKYGPPVYVRHEIVHNSHVVAGLEARGVVFVEELSEIPPTDQPVIFSAHGVPKSVPEDAKNRNFVYLDATCPLVSKVHKQAVRHTRLGRHVLLIGHQGHPEVIGTIGQLAEGQVSLIETVADAQSYQPNDNEALGFVTQTTLSVDDTLDIINALKQRFPHIEAPAAESICYATTNRQNAVKKAAQGADHFFVVGSPNSSNSMRLVEMATRMGAKKSMLVHDGNDIPWDELMDAKIVGLSAGASAPEVLINEIVGAFSRKFELNLELAIAAVEDEEFMVMRSLRNVELTPSDMAFVNGAPMPANLVPGGPITTDPTPLQAKSGGQ